MEAYRHRLERLELKYLIDTRTAARVRRAVEPYCRADVNQPGDDDLEISDSPGYRAQTLYLDTPSLAFHRAKERGDPERLKVRIRRYGNRRRRFLELKRRSADVIEKTRLAVGPGGLRDCAHGFAKLQQETPEARRFLDRYARVVLSSGAGPTLLVRYDREAYTSVVDGYARVTFDRNIAFQRTGAWTLDGEPDAWLDLESSLADGVPRPLVVLEIKCELSVPSWVVDVIRRHDLTRSSVSKYSLGIYLTLRRDAIGYGQERARGVLH